MALGFNKCNGWKTRGCEWFFKEKNNRFDFNRLARVTNNIILFVKTITGKTYTVSERVGDGRWSVRTVYLEIYTLYDIIAYRMVYRIEYLIYSYLFYALIVRQEFFCVSWRLTDMKSKYTLSSVRFDLNKYLHHVYL